MKNEAGVSGWSAYSALVLAGLVGWGLLIRSWSFSNAGNSVASWFDAFTCWGLVLWFINNSRPAFQRLENDIWAVARRKAAAKYEEGTDACRVYAQNWFRRFSMWMQLPAFLWVSPVFVIVLSDLSARVWR